MTSKVNASYLSRSHGVKQNKPPAFGSSFFMSRSFISPQSRMSQPEQLPRLNVPDYFSSGENSGLSHRVEAIPRFNNFITSNPYEQLSTLTPSFSQSNQINSNYPQRNPSQILQNIHFPNPLLDLPNFTYCNNSYIY